jgi:hypothetical protein
MNSQNFCDVVLEEGKRAVTTILGKTGIEGTMIHMGSGRVHHSAKTTEKLEEFQLTRLPYPPYSPDSSPCEFWFFSWSKNEMRGQQFHSSDDVRVFISDLWRNFDPSTLISVYRESIARSEQVILSFSDLFVTRTTSLWM